jgi:hypothetical protein
MDGTQTLKLGMGGFVDNNGCNVNCRPEDEHSLVDKATLDAQLWSNILWASRGELEHSECSYQYLQTEFMPSGKPFFRGGKFGKPILISDHKPNNIDTKTSLGICPVQDARHIPGSYT